MEPPEHTKPGSIWQVGLQPSPAAVPLSSHCSEPLHSMRCGGVYGSVDLGVSKREMGGKAVQAGGMYHVTREVEGLETGYRTPQGRSLRS